ncbi:hypothetical protein VNO77_01243 [Canavalia gladiata]|uniref:Uncharacterized protein n=1 Tax=Canavalia gladiata TaxID=3824 RepID=A0AAN9MQU0_CANGL
MRMGWARIKSVLANYFISASCPQDEGTAIGCLRQLGMKCLPMLLLKRTTTVDSKLSISYADVLKDLGKYYKEIIGLISEPVFVPVVLLLAPVPTSLGGLDPLHYSGSSTSFSNFMLVHGWECMASFIIINGASMHIFWQTTSQPHVLVTDSLFFKRFVDFSSASGNLGSIQEFTQSGGARPPLLAPIACHESPQCSSGELSLSVPWSRLKVCVACVS